MTLVTLVTRNRTLEKGSKYGIGTGKIDSGVLGVAYARIVRRSFERDYKSPDLSGFGESV